MDQARCSSQRPGPIPQTRKLSPSEDTCWPKLKSLVPVSGFLLTELHGTACPLHLPVKKGHVSLSKKALTSFPFALK